MVENGISNFVLACVVDGKTDTGISGQISQELLEELYKIFDRIMIWQNEHNKIK